MAWDWNSMFGSAQTGMQKMGYLNKDNSLNWSTMSPYLGSDGAPDWGAMMQGSPVNGGSAKGMTPGTQSLTGTPPPSATGTPGTPMVMGSGMPTMPTGNSPGLMGLLVLMAQMLQRQSSGNGGE